MSDDIDYKKIAYNEGYNIGYKNGFEAGFENAIRKYVDPGSAWMEFKDAHGNISYHCSNCDYRVESKEKTCPKCNARMQVN